MRTRYTSKRAYESDVYSWTASGPLLEHILETCSSYLIIKKPHSDVMKKIRKTYKNIGSKRLSDETVHQRETLLREIRKLNSRFHGHLLKT